MKGDFLQTGGVHHVRRKEKEEGRTTTNPDGAAPPQVESVNDSVSKAFPTQLLDIME